MADRPGSPHPEVALIPAGTLIIPLSKLLDLSKLADRQAWSA